MRRHRHRILGVGITVLLMVIALLPVTAGAATDVGTAGNPIHLSADADETTPELQILADYLHGVTGLEFVVEFADYEEPAVRWLCVTHRTNGMRVMRSHEFAYALGCNAEARLRLIRFGSSSYGTEFIVPHDSGLDTLEDLAGLEWYYSDEGSLSGYMIPLGMLNMAGVTNQTPIQAGTHGNAVQAVYDNSVASDPVPVFGTVYIDARTQIEGAHPDVFDEVRVLAESPPIPNHPIAFGPAFPASLRAQIEAALEEMAKESSPNRPTWDASLGELLSASGLDDVTAADFDSLKSVLDASGLFPWGEDYAWGIFTDDNASVFEDDIEWLAGAGITKGCNPPYNDLFCPGSSVTRGQMAAFLVRALGLTDDGGGDLFIDDDDSIFRQDIDKLAAAGITKGCNPAEGNTKFCPDSKVTREQMAAFLVRALGYSDDGGGDLFVDDDDSIFEADIDRLATAGVTKGCNPGEGNTKFCPKSYVTRGQMAAFLHRALG